MPDQAGKSRWRWSGSTAWFFATFFVIDLCLLLTFLKMTSQMWKNVCVCVYVQIIEVVEDLLKKSELKQCPRWRVSLESSVSVSRHAKYQNDQQNQNTSDVYARPTMCPCTNPDCKRNQNKIQIEQKGSLIFWKLENDWTKDKKCSDRIKKTSNKVRCE